LRAGFITTAYRNGVPDEEIMGHTRHRSLTKCAAMSDVPSSAGKARQVNWGFRITPRPRRTGRYVTLTYGHEPRSLPAHCAAL
jgi:hypothetical protein